MLASVCLLLVLGQTCRPPQWMTTTDGRQLLVRCDGVVIQEKPAPRPTAIPRPELIGIPPAPVVRPLPPDASFVFGVVDEKRTGRDRYAIGDREVTHDQLHAEFDQAAGDMLPDDAAKPHLTLFAKDPLTRNELEEMLKDASLAPLRERYRIQLYDASQGVDRMMTEGFNLAASEKFQKTGRVAVVQYAAAEGNSKVIGAEFDFATPPELLAAVPKIDPGFKLPTTPTVPSKHSLTDGERWGVVAFIAALFFLALAMKGQPSPQRKG